VLRHSVFLSLPLVVGAGRRVTPPLPHPSFLLRARTPAQRERWRKSHCASALPLLSPLPPLSCPPPPSLLVRLGSGLYANNTISVRNRQRDKSVDGAFSGILGYAEFNNRTSLGTADGSLSVFLQIPPPGPQGIAAPYDIILLGPATFGPYGLYEYAVVSDPLEISLFVLARDVQTFYDKYNATVMETLRADGFINPINEPRQTVQDGCTPYSETDLWTCIVDNYTSTSVY
jgi:hypothetical protein